jgi:glycosyltransferase involved in cell wall biosynthesis
MKHPEAGGAEVHLHEILKGLVWRGHDVTLLSSSFPEAAPVEKIDGIKTIRAGGWWNANFLMPYKYMTALRGGGYDLIIEDINKLPFFTPLYARCPVVAIVPHLFGTTVFQETSVPFALYVWSYEAFIPLVYRSAPFIAISESTRDDLIGRGLPASNVHLVHCGMDHGTYSFDSGVKKDKTPTVVFLGRLRKYKGVQILLRAMSAVREKVPGTKLVVVGDGPYRGELERIAAELGLGDAVRFAGYVSQEEKVRLLRTSHVAASPSPKEGWGLTVVEANACGTPVVASRSPGLRDSVRDGETGYLVAHGDELELAGRIVELLQDESKREKMSAAAVQWAGTFTWERCAAECAEIMEKVREERG